MGRFRAYIFHSLTHNAMVHSDFPQCTIKNQTTSCRDKGFPLLASNSLQCEEVAVRLIGHRGAQTHKCDTRLDDLHGMNELQAALALRWTKFWTNMGAVCKLVRMMTLCTRRTKEGRNQPETETITKANVPRFSVPQILETWHPQSLHAQQ